ncbi:hypothetical protein EXN66_Car019765 [Channa argus]|uniref:Uncharacterized protein n=1 Tax=Channa argus TaxID=215402 RepID=A0A6G1QNM7_CHAAH|nr:hypothetical protein EXN66_Car019765 [Channa argus]
MLHSRAHTLKFRRYTFLHSYLVTLRYYGLLVYVIILYLARTPNTHTHRAVAAGLHLCPLVEHHTSYWPQAVTESKKVQMK